MTGKVRLTKEQADAVISISRHYKPDHILKKHYSNRNWFQDDHVLVRDILFHDLARVLYEPNSFEIKLDYKVGDWVIRTETSQDSNPLNDKYRVKGYVFKVVKSCRDGVVDERLLKHMLQKFRHATPEEVKTGLERQLWAGIGRGIGEFRNGDIGIEKIDGTWLRVCNHDYNLSNAYKTGRLTGFYPAESFISFNNEED